MKTMRHIPTRDEIHTLMRVAMGEVKADLVIRNANLLNVYTGEFLDGHSVAVKGSRIAYVGKDADHAVGDVTRVIDTDGKTLIPGLIDGHTHLGKFYDIHGFLPYAIKDGTTTIITETMEIFPVAGCEGVMEYLASFKDQPVKIFGTAPAMCSISTAAAGISEETLHRLLDEEDMLGLGETYWQSVFQDPGRMLPGFEITLRRGKVLEGHSAGASDKKLAAYTAAGISSCHEPINLDQALERLRLGLYVMIREGSIRRDLAEIAGIRDMNVDFRRLILSTDGVDPEDLMEKGYMGFVVQKAIDSGFNPIDAVRMATLNVAEHFSLDHLVGGIAPGRYADMILLADPRKIEPETVISNGTVICRNGEILVRPRPHVFSKASLNSVRLPRPVKPEDFVVRVGRNGSSDPPVRVRVIQMITDLVTREEILTLPVTNGEIHADTDQDILKVSAVDRTMEPGKMFTGLIKGFGMKKGALATTLAWDTSDIVAVGANDADIAAAVNRVHDLQGGAVIWADGRVRAEIACPIMGLMSDAPMDRLREDLRAVKQAAAALGVPFPDPLLTLTTLTGAAIPYLRICEQGLVNLANGQATELVIKH